MQSVFSKTEDILLRLFRISPYYHWFPVITQPERINSEQCASLKVFTHLGPYAPQGSRKLPKWSRCSKSVLQTLIRTSEVRYSRSIGELNSIRVTSSLLRKWIRLQTHACEVRALTFEVTDNFGSNGVLPCGAYGPWALLKSWTWHRSCISAPI